MRQQGSGEGSDGAGRIAAEPRIDGLPDPIEHSAEVHQHLLVGKAQDFEPLSLQPRITLGITPTALLRLMGLTVEFDDQTRGGTQEIRDERRDRGLPAEL
ncbi:hypothetical protein QO012_000715 [Methylobacterium aerolatum]|uniref:Uncharacterized protein n=1 Tax=Methylobacterium aerolatum TaxID=418708 RepID=A0ABU0HV72_9HYPH|nr:hypothetical protein [Methylobacterium aerolatum]